MVSIRAMELETAKEILAEVFGARPGEVEEMIQMRLEESRPVEERNWQEESARKGDGRRRSAWGSRCGTEIRLAYQAPRFTFRLHSLHIIQTRLFRYMST
jgi:hypothetical protein